MGSSDATVTDRRREQARRANRLLYRFSSHWLLFFNIFLGILVTLPWLAPIFMELEMVRTARGIHFVYQALCHQYPQRSYFLFGPQFMYTLEEVGQVWPDTANPLIIRQFIGTPEMGWKIAWSDRMVSMYGGLFLFGVVYALLRRWIKPLSLWGLIFFSIPMAIDGVTHTISDLYGLGQGFRDSNVWLAELTNYAFDPLFYAGSDLGSFNWWMRLFTGLLFALGVIWFAFPHLDFSFRQTSRTIETKFDHAGLEL